MRDRLIELLGNFPVWHSTLKENWMPEAVERLADHLLAEGVIVPPCKVGDAVYMPWRWHGADGIAILTVGGIIICEAGLQVYTDLTSDDEEFFYSYNCGVFELEDFGKTVFLTREEAERALAERREDGND